MSEDATAVPARSLRRTTRAALGDELRSVVHFTSDGYEQVYLRDDLDDEADLTSFVGHERAGFARQDTDVETELGDYEYTIHGFDRGFIVRVTGPERGVFVTTDELTMSRFDEVATALGTVLDGTR